MIKVLLMMLMICYINCASSQSSISKYQQASDSIKILLDEAANNYYTTYKDSSSYILFVRVFNATDGKVILLHKMSKSSKSVLYSRIRKSIITIANTNYPVIYDDEWFVSIPYANNLNVIENNFMEGFQIILDKDNSILSSIWTE